ncbi:MAG: undecaprenyl-diphosphatase [Clostridiales bacterium]|nr:MAG: undecaprenyl-diphosphatase [Clostridiales bacterium]
MIFKAIILGIIEGITEFLPISSTGHLVLMNKVFDLEGSFANIFSIVIQIGAIFSVIVYFFKDLIPKSTEKKDIEDFLSLWLKVVVGVIPAAAIGLLFEDAIDKYLFKPTVIAFALIIGGIWILLVDKNDIGDRKYKDIKDLTYKMAFCIGLFQCLALVPGTSRSAMTIIGGLMIGTSRKLAAEFSFFMAIPVLGGAAFLKVIKNLSDFSSDQISVLAVGTFVSFVVSYFVIASLMKFIKKHNFRPFAYYRIVLGGIVLMFL